MRVLSLLEARVLGVLVEKAATVPDSYPLSLNALVLGCNQKTARDPVLAASDAEVQQAVDALRALNLVFETSGSRVARYEHNLPRALGVPSAAAALLAVLALRGPQTASELRANSERLHRFADVSSVEAFLDELAARADDKGGPLALKLPRAPGTRESRWVQLLTGPVDVGALSIAAAASDEPVVALGELAALRAEQQALRREIDALRTEVDSLRAEVARLYRELGVSRG